MPVAETLAVLDEFVRAGQVREIGCCNFTAAMLAEADQAAADGGFRRFASVQNLLNLFQRAALDEVLPACAEFGLSFIPYHPLASGMLTGKYPRTEAPPSDTRLTGGLTVTPEARARLFSEKTFARLEALEGFAGEHGHTLLELAFAWLLTQPTVATVIAGAARPGQVTANAAAATWRLPPAEAAQATQAVLTAA